MSITRLLRGVLPMILALTCLLTGCTIGDTDYVLDANYVGRNDVLEINGEAITKEEALLYLCNYQNLYGEEYGLDLWQAGLNTSDLTLEEYIKEITLLQISDITCMSQLATQMGVTLTQAEEETLSVVAKEYYRTLTQEELSYIGIDEKTVLASYRKYALANKLYLQLTSGINEEVSLDEARVLRLQVIYVSSKGTANEILAKLEAGKSFITLANSYNEGEEVEMIVARGDLSATLESAVYALDEGERTDAIATESGYYFFLCVSKNETELTERNKELILQRRKEEQFKKVFQSFIETSEFQMNQKLWNEITPNSSSNITTRSFFEIYDNYFTGD